MGKVALESFYGSKISQPRPRGDNEYTWKFELRAGTLADLTKFQNGTKSQHFDSRDGQGLAWSAARNVKSYNTEVSVPELSAFLVKGLEAGSLHMVGLYNQETNGGWYETDEYVSIVNGK